MDEVFFLVVASQTWQFMAQHSQRHVTVLCISTYSILLQCSICTLTSVKYFYSSTTALLYLWAVCEPSPVHPSLGSSPGWSIYRCGTAEQQKHIRKLLKSFRQGKTGLKLWNKCFWVLDLIMDWTPGPCWVYLVVHLLLELVLKPADPFLQGLNLSAKERDGGGTLVLRALRHVPTPTPGPQHRQVDRLLETWGLHLWPEVSKQD